MKIYVVGFMGSGKTTIGRELAARLEIPFFDLDELVESSEGMSVKEIFADKGEPHFRKREREILRTTKWLEHGVVATGGGTFTFEDNIQFIKSEGLSLYLSAPFPLLHSRIGEKAAERPLFRDENATRELYQQRLRFYKLSDLTLELKEDETIREAVERALLLLPTSIRRRER